MKLASGCFCLHPRSEILQSKSDCPSLSSGRDLTGQVRIQLGLLLIDPCLVQDVPEDLLPLPPTRFLIAK
eukprot:9499267-Pyramimonas_sp.AAC.1